MKFSKMQGIGNDYIYVNCFEETVNDPAALAVRLSDRHFGIGSDGLILIRPTPNGDAMMDLYNADGSRAMMCGNGIRCVGKYVYEKGIARRDVLRIDTLSGVKTLYLTVEDGKVDSVKVAMGEPEFMPERIPVAGYDVPVLEQSVEVCGESFKITCVSTVSYTHLDVYKRQILNTIWKGGKSRFLLVSKFFLKRFQERFMSAAAFRKTVQDRKGKRRGVFLLSLIHI